MKILSSSLPARAKPNPSSFVVNLTNTEIYGRSLCCGIKCRISFPCRCGFNLSYGTDNILLTIKVY